MRGGNVSRYTMSDFQIIEIDCNNSHSTLRDKASRRRCRRPTVREEVVAFNMNAPEVLEAIESAVTETRSEADVTYRQICLSLLDTPFTKRQSRSGSSDSPHAQPQAYVGRGAGWAEEAC
ncbi:hypothetical protein ACEPAI_1569 [Sanghuangporus weigelae]